MDARPPLIESVEPAADAATEAAVRVVWADAVGGGETVVSHAEVRERAVRACLAIDYV